MSTTSPQTRTTEAAPETHSGVLSLLAFLVSALFAGLTSSWWFARSASSDGCGEFDFVNADFSCGDHPVIEKVGYAALAGAIEELIVAERQAGRISAASVYFRDYRGGPSFSVAGEQVFIPASLLKVPVLLTYYALAEEGHDYLQTPLRYAPDAAPHFPVPPQHLATSPGLVVGQTYPLERLIEAVLTTSDNLAYAVLREHLDHVVPLGPARRALTLQELGLVDPYTEYEETISARGYQSVFRMLYNASYLDEAHSERLLSWLAASTFDAGLEAGVPEHVVVAHKFGERAFGGRTQQVHDCGIVYFPGNPYGLCVMTKGGNWADSVNFIASVSRMVFDEVDGRRIGDER